MTRVIRVRAIGSAPVPVPTRHSASCSKSGKAVCCDLCEQYRHQYCFLDHDAVALKLPASTQRGPQRANTRHAATGGARTNSANSCTGKKEDRRQLSRSCLDTDAL